MNIKEIASLGDLKMIAGKQERAFLLLFKGGTEKSECIINALSGLDGEIKGNITFLKADVQKVRDIHPVYGIESVPALLEFRSGSLMNVFKGCNSREFYINAINGSMPGTYSTGEEKKQKNVIVYSTPACPWCNTLKTYLRERKIQFRDVDVSVDQKAAEQMVNKSGHQGVPQADIDGHIIVGFDKKKIDSLLELG
ncbi:MAG: glutathione S-transferase N-terminal domain-containing protein [Bacteroidales bacterium]|nr:glutathione S-transferase N-terminal domain-containing protein [Bacteroidales bacterium]